jgi:hypothetical protein
MSDGLLFGGLFEGSMQDIFIVVRRAIVVERARTEPVEILGQSFQVPTESVYASVALAVYKHSLYFLHNICHGEKIWSLEPSIECVRSVE